MPLICTVDDTHVITLVHRGCPLAHARITIHKFCNKIHECAIQNTATRTRVNTYSILPLQLDWSRLVSTDIATYVAVDVNGI